MYACPSRAETLAAEIKELQSEMADYNTVGFLHAFALFEKHSAVLPITAC